MKNSNIFIGGPIQYAITATGFDHPLKSIIETAISVVKLTGATVFYAHRHEQFGVTTPQATPQLVSTRDFHWMKHCDVFVPILPLESDSCLLRTDGTHIELGWASAFDRPIVMITTSPIANGGSHLLKGLRHIDRK